MQLSKPYKLDVLATNTRNENTAIGAGTGAVVGGALGTIAKGAGRGWVIAAGAVVGALTGGWLGHSADSSDNSQMNTALDKNDIDEPSKWTNDKTGVWYKIVPTSGVISYKGSTYCRHYEAYGKVNGKTQTTKGVACRSADGMWQQVK